ncbi:Cytochrome P450, E-class, group I [Trema orientale]|uniref:Cytochrome P450, E-class, group I n=1 Tax=Trema orientale TaxID=63057 RepID=A0A2P5AXG7_TREOI|nr:Cytochrome P450, E-class, group I [Trema orientale]
METYLFQTSVASSVLFLILYFVVKVIHNIWWKPIHLEKLLRQQGIKGTPYKLLRGDMEEIRRSTMEAWSKPMSLNHHIVPRVLPFFYDMVQKYGKVCLSWTETRPRLIIGDSELIRVILADKKGHFVKPPQNPFVDLLQLGVSTLEGEQWVKRRRLLTPAFHLDKLKGMLPAFAISCSALIDRWKNLTRLQGSTEVDVAPEFQILTGDVIARTAFGSSYEEGKKIFELQKEQAVLVLEAYHNIYIPGFRFVPTRKNMRRYKLDNEIKAVLRDLIRKKQQAMPNKEVDLLSLLLQKCELEGEAAAEDDNNCLTIDDVIEECKLFYIAGQETTANLLTWTMIVLSMHPNWQDKAREEVLRVCGKKTPDFEAINHLKIVSMILNEVLRLYPLLTAHLRYTKQEANIGGMLIPAGVEILLFTLSLHHDPKHWGHDATEFNPERFSEGVAKSSKDDQMAFYPFGWGPRICLGQNFAMIEAKLGLAMILQHFSFQLSLSYTHAPCTGITLQPQHGAPIVLHCL